MSGKLNNCERHVGEKSILRQCDPEFIDQIIEEISGYDAILSMACGAGVQGVAEKIQNLPVLPAMNTRFIGMTDGKGTWTEVCDACGDCVLGITGGICPIATCPKGILNGPCGGNKNGKCEVNLEMPCAWVRIYEKTKELGRLDDLKKLISAKDWSKKQRPGTYGITEKEAKKSG